MSNLPTSNKAPLGGGTAPNSLLNSIQGKQDDKPAEPTIEELAAAAKKEQDEADTAQAILDAAKVAEKRKYRYATIGDPVFNCNGVSNLIRFKDGLFSTDSDDDAELLEHFVKTKRIEKV